MAHYLPLTLLSDFGLSDSYVGVMKGVIAQINPSLLVIDLTHQIPPQDVTLARFSLMTAYPYFPMGTVHVAVVDPGVGSRRRAIAVAFGADAAQPTGFLVGPDNGLFSGVLSQQPMIAAIALTNPQYWRTPEPSLTFHGRDIFAPVGAHLASGVPLEQLGETIAPESLVTLPVATWQRVDARGPAAEPSQRSADFGRETVIVGGLQAIDHFGNVITTVPGTLVAGRSWSVLWGELAIARQITYSHGRSGELVALIGSHGWVEIAVSNGSAQAKLKIDRTNLEQFEVKVRLND